MTPRWTPLAIVYLIVAILGLIGTWIFNILAITRRLRRSSANGSRMARRRSRCWWTCWCSPSHPGSSS